MAKVICSGGFDPIHVGHLDSFKDAAKHGDVIIALNSDQWLIDKKGRCFMPWSDRAKILKSFSIISEVINFKDDRSGTANNALIKIRKKYPKEELYFANGGDRTVENVPETKTCNEKNIKMLWNVGGLKSRSSSLLLEKYGETLAVTQRHWGQYRILSEEPGYKVKELIINPFKGISLQTHEYRSEHWTIIEGVAQVRKGQEIFELHPNQTVYIPQGCLHQLKNSNNVPLKLIEVQVGTYFGEDDIKRYEE